MTATSPLAPSLPYPTGRCDADGCGRPEEAHRPGAFRWDGHAYTPPAWHPGAVAVVTSTGCRATLHLGGDDIGRAWVSLDRDPGFGPMSYPASPGQQAVIGGHPDALERLHRWALDRPNRSAWHADMSTPGARAFAEWTDQLGAVLDAVTAAIPGRNPRTLTPRRRAQGFRSQAHLDAFYAYRDHVDGCAECQRPGPGVELADGWQPTRRECDTARELYLREAGHSAHPVIGAIRPDGAVMGADGEWHPAA